jgi:hypothetical protein
MTAYFTNSSLKLKIYIYIYSFRSSGFPQSHLNVNIFETYLNFINFKYTTAVHKQLFDSHLEVKHH